LALADLEAHCLNQEEPERTSLGIAALEAMLAGKVVLAVANPDTYQRGVLKHNENIVIGESGMPLELAHTISELLKDDKRCQEIGHRAQRIIQDHYSWDSIYAQTIQVYGLRFK
jgi:glycosyltransferase involved in cell wall biosynthesis